MIGFLWHGTLSPVKRWLGSARRKRCGGYCRMGNGGDRTSPLRNRWNAPRSQQPVRAYPPTTPNKHPSSPRLKMPMAVCGPRVNGLLH
uniref:Z10f protein n=1 Tax=Vibrio cholerae TaxID=666 RepID=O87025_VIBCL|nr:z10f [Vibrio cholerae]